jgi:GNAT superfamily N-acetyltransferase
MAGTDTDVDADGRVLELATEAGWREAYPVMNELRPQEEATFLRRMERMYEEGYRLFGLYDDRDLVSLAGVRELMTLYHGNHVWVYDLVTTEDRRSEGFGAEILAWVADWARERDANVLELASGLWREQAHEFYEREGMERFCYTFTMEL